MSLGFSQVALFFMLFITNGLTLIMKLMYSGHVRAH